MEIDVDLNFFPRDEISQLVGANKWASPTNLLNVSLKDFSALFRYMSVLRDPIRYLRKDILCLFLQPSLVLM